MKVRQFVFRTKPSFIPQGMYLTPGVPTQVTYDKLAAYLNPNNMEMSGINPATFANSQQLPEGFYTFTIESARLSTWKM